MYVSTNTHLCWYSWARTQKNPATYLPISTHVRVRTHAEHTEHNFKHMVTCKISRTHIRAQVWIHEWTYAQRTLHTQQVVLWVCSHKSSLLAAPMRSMTHFCFLNTWSTKQICGGRAFVLSPVAPSAPRMMPLARSRHSWLLELFVYPLFP